MSRTNGWPPVILFFSIALLGSILHCSLETSLWTWRDVLPSLYYLPVVIAAINLGSKAALGVAIASGAAHSAASAIGCSDPWILPLAETILFVCVGLTAASLAAKAHGSPLGAEHSLLDGSADEGLVNAFQGAQTMRSAPALREMAAGLIRRFRTPVSSIEGAVWLLEDARFPEEKREEFVRLIRKETHQLDRALSDILEFTQPRKPRLSKVDLSGLVDRVIQMAGPREHGPFLVFRKEIAPDLPPLNCDPELITKMLQNLAINAIQATPNGGQIRISVTVEADNAVITIKDPGRGIAPGTAHRLFEPFFSTRENGLGLGLSVAQQIAAAHGGTIEIKNDDERGASVTVALPLTASPRNEHGSNISS